MSTPHERPWREGRGEGPLGYDCRPADAFYNISIKNGSTPMNLIQGACWGVTRVIPQFVETK